jgi:hypothetical protein
MIWTLAIVPVASLASVLVYGLTIKRKQRETGPADAGARRILFPFTTDLVSQRPLHAALRLADFDRATLVAVSLDSTIREGSSEPEVARSLLGAIEQCAAGFGVTVEARTLPGRSYREAICELVALEAFDTVCVMVGSGSACLGPGELSWLVRRVPGEIFLIHHDSDAADPNR